MGENKNSASFFDGRRYPTSEIIFGGHDSFREPMIIGADEFIAKGFQSKTCVTTVHNRNHQRTGTTRRQEPAGTEELRKRKKSWTLDPDHER